MNLEIGFLHSAMPVVLFIEIDNQWGSFLGGAVGLFHR
jgi:hypothetical protein